jgi:hypothetical protein
MPRGRPKKNTAVEILPPEEDNQSQVQVREVKHKTEWVELRPVEEASDSDTELEEIEIEDKPRRKVTKNEREELRKTLAQNNITPASQLKLTIERYLHSEHVEGGTWAESEYLTKYTCSREHITSEEYLDVARKFGPGTYRFTLRLQNKIVTAWDKRLGVVTPSPVIQNVAPTDPTSPQVIIQSDGQQTVMPSIKDIMKVQREALKEQLEMAKLMREAYGFAPEQQQQQPKTEEEILAGAIIKQPEVIDNLVGGIIKRYGKGNDSDEPWYADVVRDAVKSGQAAQIVQVAIDRIFNGFNSLFPGRANNGQTQVVQTPHQNQTQSDQQQVLSIPGQQTTPDQSLQPSSSSSSNMGSGGTIGQIEQTPTQITPEQHALSRLIDNCQRRIPVQVAYQQLINYADAINEQAPDYSIDGYIDLLGSVTTDQALDYVKTLPGGEQIVSLPHTKEWTAELQKLIQAESQEGEE